MKICDGCFCIALYICDGITSITFTFIIYMNLYEWYGWHAMRELQYEFAFLNIVHLRITVNVPCLQHAGKNPKWIHQIFLVLPKFSYHDGKGSLT